MLMLETKGIKINGKSIHCITFAGVIAFVTDSEENMMLLSLTNTLRYLKFKLSINSKKTKAPMIGNV